MSHSACIHNVGEYFSPHYLESAFSSDIKQIIEETESENQNRESLSGAGEMYFEAKEEAIEKDKSFQNPKIRAFIDRIWNALGYSREESVYLFEGKKTGILLEGLIQRNSEPYLGLLEANVFYPGELKEKDSPHPLEEKFVSKSFSVEGISVGEFGSLTRAILAIFGEEKSPRFLIAQCGRNLYLFDRHTFSEGRHIEVDLEEAFSRKETKGFQEILGLFSKAIFTHEEEIYDKLGDNSHKYAFGVTSRLQVAVRSAIETLANDWVRYRREKNLSYTELSGKELKHAGFKVVTADRLKHEALTYIYRILFILYAEARGEKGILPMDSDVYRLGYSFESLRDLELIPLQLETLTGTYFHEHLKTLFSLIQNGYPENWEEKRDSIDFQTPFVIQPLTSRLFHPEESFLLDHAELSNEALQKVVVSLSLSESAKGKGRGRINYANLGISQLGAVYEGILSYSAVFAEEDLIQVAKGDGKKSPEFEDPSVQTWFVSKKRKAEFERWEIEQVSEGNGERVYPKGTFLLVLSHVDRERTASYYTPQVLTKCLVEEAIEELLKDFTSERADEILDLLLCEPAMGSGAFLEEATSQLADAYLSLKQKQIGETIEPENYENEKNRVKYYIAQNNVYGVDLNPMAVELGSLSLWLGTQYREGGESEEKRKKDKEEKHREKEREIRKNSGVPFFKFRLVNGNSLIGARRSVIDPEILKKGVGDELSVRFLKPGEERKETEVYSFLVFQKDMVPLLSEKLYGETYPESVKKGKEWLKNEVARPYEDLEIRLLQRISQAVDRSFEILTEFRKSLLRQSRVEVSLFGQKKSTTESRPGLEEWESQLAELEKETGEYAKLRFLMDAYSSLYFWDVETEGKNLPRREDFLYTASALLGIDPSSEKLLLHESQTKSLEKIATLFGKKDLSYREISQTVKWGEIVERIRDEQKFLHWEIVFPEVLGFGSGQRGFDLLLGNPPWLKQEWNEGAVLDGIDPKLGVRGAKSADYNRERKTLIEKDPILYFRELRFASGINAFLNSGTHYPILKKIQTNLYKNFLVKTWDLMSPNGVTGLLHPTNLFDDPNGGRLREEVYPRLRKHFQFINEMQLFADVGHQAKYSINIYSFQLKGISFISLFNLYHPKTITDSKYSKNQSKFVPGIKNEKKEWETKGHPERIIRFQNKEMEIIHELFGGETLYATKLPQIHAKPILEILKIVGKSEKTLKDLKEESFSTEMYHESNSQRDGFLKRQDNPSFQPKSPDELVLVGPLLYVGNPLYGTAYKSCTEKSSFDDIDLTEISETFLPRSPYKPLKKDPFLVTMGKDDDGNPIKVNAKDYYRIAWRSMANITQERTIMSCVIPKGVSHIHGVSNGYIISSLITIQTSGILCSLVVDFLLRFTGANNLKISNFSFIPLIQDETINTLIRHRVLRLNCLTEQYSELWEECSEGIEKDTFFLEDERLVYEFESPWKDLDSKWNWKSPLRSDFARRLALLEIDVLVAKGFGLSLEHLELIYTLQFPVLQQYEAVDEYDSRGRRLPNTARKDPGGTQLREARKRRNEEIARGDAKESDPLEVKFPVDGGTREVTKTFYPPFVGVDRVLEYRRIWGSAPLTRLV
ncbi:MAG: hypothetical protein KDK54_17415 [Leptospiraceae bacterium]|nr:hypothetical protein [Leptospiraceae bacterium]